MTGINVCYYVPFSPSAAVPPLDFPQNQSHYVLVPVSGPALTQLNCDIGPGSARESYTIQWVQININTNITQGINHQNFSLTLSVDVNSNGRMYMCRVTIDHDGIIRRTYDGAKITLHTSGKLAYAHHALYTAKRELFF